MPERIVKQPEAQQTPIPTLSRREALGLLVRVAGIVGSGTSLFLGSEKLTKPERTLPQNSQGPKKA